MAITSKTFQIPVNNVHGQTISVLSAGVSGSGWSLDASWSVPFNVDAFQSFNVPVKLTYDPDHIFSWTGTLTVTADCGSVSVPLKFDVIYCGSGSSQGCKNCCPSGTDLASVNYKHVKSGSTYFLFYRYDAATKIYYYRNGASYLIFNAHYGRWITAFGTPVTDVTCDTPACEPSGSAASAQQHVVYGENTYTLYLYSNHRYFYSFGTEYIYYDEQYQLWYDSEDAIIENVSCEGSSGASHHSEHSGHSGTSHHSETSHQSGSHTSHHSEPDCIPAGEGPIDDNPVKYVKVGSQYFLYTAYSESGNFYQYDVWGEGSSLVRFYVDRNNWYSGDNIITVTCAAAPCPPTVDQDGVVDPQFIIVGGLRYNFFSINDTYINYRLNSDTADIQWIRQHLLWSYAVHFGYTGPIIETLECPGSESSTHSDTGPYTPSELPCEIVSWDAYKYQTAGKSTSGSPYPEKTAIYYCDINFDGNDTAFLKSPAAIFFGVRSYYPPPGKEWVYKSSGYEVSTLPAPPVKSGINATIKATTPFVCYKGRDFVYSFIDFGGYCFIPLTSFSPYYLLKNVFDAETFNARNGTDLPIGGWTEDHGGYQFHTCDSPVLRGPCCEHSSGSWAASEASGGSGGSGGSASDTSECSDPCGGSIFIKYTYEQIIVEGEQPWSHGVYSGKMTRISCSPLHYRGLFSWTDSRMDRSGLPDVPVSNFEANVFWDPAANCFKFQNGSDSVIHTTSTCGTSGTPEDTYYIDEQYTQGGVIYRQTGSCVVTCAGDSSGNSQNSGSGSGSLECVDPKIICYNIPEWSQPGNQIVVDAGEGYVFSEILYAHWGTGTGTGCDDWVPICDSDVSAHAAAIMLGNRIVTLTQAWEEWGFICVGEFKNLVIKVKACRVSGSEGSSDNGSGSFQELCIPAADGDPTSVCYGTTTYYYYTSAFGTRIYSTLPNGSGDRIYFVYDLAALQAAAEAWGWTNVPTAENIWVLDGQATPILVKCGECFSAPLVICAVNSNATLNVDYGDSMSIHYVDNGWTLYIDLVIDAVQYNNNFGTNFSNGDYVETYPAWMGLRNDVTPGPC